MKKIIKKVFQLLKEPSSMAGFVGLMVALKVFDLTEGQWQDIAKAIVAVATAVLAILIPEGKKKVEEE